MISIRAFQLADKSHLPRFLALAAHETDVKIVLDNPKLARYIENFGSMGDCAFVAHNDEEIVGVVWARFWTIDNCGFGWVDEKTPEMAIAIENNFQNIGIGTRLIQELKSELRAQNATQISLNVRADSPAVRLYRKMGFEEIAESERTNRVGGVSFNMLAPLR